MIMALYAIKDELNGYTSPIPFMNEELARRYLKDQYMSNPTVKNTPEDFSIWKLGTLETETGHIESEVTLLERAKNYAE